MTAPDKVLTVADVPGAALQSLLRRYGLQLVVQANGTPIRGSFWGDREAGIVGLQVFVRSDTPVHSLLHECCHTICMPASRRESLDGDAGGDDLEETAVCYLQIVLADQLHGVGSDRLMRDMDAWGYSFRLGSAAAWYASDAEDARNWLINRELLKEGGQPTFRLNA